MDASGSNYRATGLLGKGSGMLSTQVTVQATLVCRAAARLQGCHTSGEPILRTLPSSLWGNVAMPTPWLLLIIIYECTVQPSDKQFFSSLAWGPFSKLS